MDFSMPGEVGQLVGSASPAALFVPPQHRVDLMVEDVEASTAPVLALGALKLDGDGVFADPAGHPFCLIRRPEWAPLLPRDD
jgi:hypothetical protein